MASYQVTFNIQAVFDLWCDLQGFVPLPRSQPSPPLSACLARLLPFARRPMIVLLWDRLRSIPIHREWISIAHDAASSALPPPSPSLFLSLLFPRYLSAIHPSFSPPLPICIRNPCLSVGYTRLTKYHTVNISRKEPVNTAKTANSCVQPVVPCNIACLGDDRCLHHANRLLDRHGYLLLVISFLVFDEL